MFRILFVLILVNRVGAEDLILEEAPEPLPDISPADKQLGSYWRTSKITPSKAEQSSTDGKN